MQEPKEYIVLCVECGRDLQEWEGDICESCWALEQEPDEDEETGEIEDFDGICAFCGEELEYASTGGVFCRNCGYDEDYERSKVSGDDY